MDDDSSSQNIFQWDFGEVMKTDQLLTIPKKSGGKKANKGKLPLSHPQWQKLADHNHWMRCLARQYDLQAGKTAIVQKSCNYCRCQTTEEKVMLRSTRNLQADGMGGILPSFWDPQHMWSVVSVASEQRQS
jgi:hypothetical protein